MGFSPCLIWSDRRHRGLGESQSTANFSHMKTDPRERYNHLVALGFRVYRVHGRGNVTVIVMARDGAIRVIRTCDEGLVSRVLEEGISKDVTEDTAGRSGGGCRG